MLKEIECAMPLSRAGPKDLIQIGLDASIVRKIEVVVVGSQLCVYLLICCV